MSNFKENNELSPLLLVGTIVFAVLIVLGIFGACSDFQEHKALLKEAQAKQQLRLENAVKDQ